MAKDLFHNAVRAALQKENWTITDDPLKIGAGGTKFEIDLGAERLIAADRGTEHIAVEIKTFAGESLITDDHQQFTSKGFDRRSSVVAQLRPLTQLSTTIKDNAKMPEIEPCAGGV
jgi:XisH protein